MPYRHPIGDPIERPADSTEAVRTSIDIAASADEVFHALCDPCQLAAWLGGDPVSAPSDAREAPAAPDLAAPASRWDARVVAPDGTIGVVNGEYVSIVPPHRLETTWRASWNDFAPERVRFELVPIDVSGSIGTRVTVTHTRALMRAHAPSSAFGRSIAHADLWPTLLARLSVHVVTAASLARWSAPRADVADTFASLHRAVVELHHAY
jgi:uncharacterized protein YndB with AHSA1/START domain